MTISQLPRADGQSLAYRHRTGRAPGILFCPGFNSNMDGVKARFLESVCENLGHQYTRFDYFGHGSSTGSYRQGTIGRWKDDALAVLDNITRGPQIIVGSSMGGWIMLLVALARSDRITSLIGIAPAVDFTKNLVNRLNNKQRLALQRDGYCDVDNQYDDGEPYRINQHLLDESGLHFLLEKPIPINCPVRLLHGLCDEDVPWKGSVELIEQLDSDDVELQLVENGNHRLSEPEDLHRLKEVIVNLLSRAVTISS